MINDNFCLLEDFIPETTIQLLTNNLVEKKFEYTEQTDTRLANFVLSANGDQNNEIYQKFQQIYIDIKNKVEDFYNCDVYDEPFCNVIEYNVGDFLHPHLDTQPQYDGSGKLIFQAPTPSGKPVRHYSTVLYINDDYSGGEIFFPNFDLEIKPKAGSALTWPSSEPFTHGVKKILSGKKWITPVFWNMKEG